MFFHFIILLLFFFWGGGKKKRENKKTTTDLLKGKKMGRRLIRCFFFLMNLVRHTYIYIYRQWNMEDESSP